MFLRALRIVVIAVCVIGIAGMIIGTVATDNNNGVVITFGMMTAVAVVVLMAVTAAIRSQPATGAVAPQFDEELAARVEQRVQDLVAAGADETAVRALVGDAVHLGRTAT